MKICKGVIYLLLLVVFVSCIREEAPNAEADILECIVSDDILKRDPIIENSKIILMVKSDVDLSQQAPEFVLTKGATIFPASGTERDFTLPQYYTVTSEDGNWNKEYQVVYVIAGISNEYHFEKVKTYTSSLLKYTYDIFYENDQNGNWSMDWATANPGFALTGAGSTAETFPTCSVGDGKKGKGVKLQTCSTGSFGAGMKMPIAAGNLYMGTFNVGSVLANPLKATQFGLPFEYIPTYLKGYFKYTAGPEYKDVSGTVYPDKKDTWDIYALFYETDDQVKALDGTNRFTHPNLISIARIPEEEHTESNEWTEFYIPFHYLPGKSVDYEKLKAGKYNLAIVFTSSIEGDLFKGSIGSTLYIDEVELIYASED